MKAAVLAIIPPLLTLCYFLLKPNPDADYKHIQGIWSIQSATQDGELLKDVGFEMHFVEDTLTVTAVGGDHLMRFTFAVDPMSKLKILALQQAGEQSPFLPGNCAYELNGDDLRLAFCSPDKHPTEVSDKGQVLITLKRRKP